MSLLRTLRPHLRPLAQPHRHFSTTPLNRNLARMTLIGRLAGPPEQQQTSTGAIMYKYAIGTNYGSQENRQVSWFNITAFVDENAPEYTTRRMQELEKGSLLHVEADGRMVSVDSRVPGEEGQKRKVLNLVQRNLQVLAKPLASASREAGNQAGNVEGADGAYTESG